MLGFHCPSRVRDLGSRFAHCSFCCLQNAKNKALEQRLEVLTTERDDAKILAKELKVIKSCSAAKACLRTMLKLVWLLQSQSSRPQGASEMQMVAAVSQATRAAAEAATAAAGAAAICIIDPRDGSSRVVQTSGRRPARRRRRKQESTSGSEDDASRTQDAKQQDDNASRPL